MKLRDATMAVSVVLVSLGVGCDSSVVLLPGQAGSGEAGVTGVGGSGVGGRGTDGGTGGGPSGGGRGGDGGDPSGSCDRGPFVLVGGLGETIGILADASSVYVAQMPPDAIVARVPKLGGELEVLVADLYLPRIALDGETLWVSSSDGVFRIPLAGGPMESFSSDFASGVAFDDANVFWVDYAGGFVKSSKKDLVDVTTWLDVPNADRIAVTPHTIYFTDLGADGVQAMDRSSLATYTIGDRHVCALLTDGDVLYFASDDYQDAALWRVDANATEPVLLAGLNGLGQHPTELLSTDGTMLYGGVTPEYGQGSIYRVPTTGGALEVVSAADYPRGVAVDGTRVYWVDANHADPSAVGSVRCAPKAPARGD